MKNGSQALPLDLKQLISTIHCKEALLANMNVGGKNIQVLRLLVGIDPESILWILERFSNELSYENFRGTPLEQQSGKTILWKLAKHAAKGHPAPFLEFWKKYHQQITKEDLLCAPIHYFSKEQFWAEVEKSCHGSKKLLNVVKENIEDKILTCAIEESNVITLLIEAALNNYPGPLQEVYKNIQLCSLIKESVFKLFDLNGEDSWFQDAFWSVFEDYYFVFNNNFNHNQTFFIALLEMIDWAGAESGDEEDNEENSEERRQYRDHYRNLGESIYYASKTATVFELSFEQLVAEVEHGPYQGFSILWCLVDKYPCQSDEENEGLAYFWYRYQDRFELQHFLGKGRKNRTALEVLLNQAHDDCKVREKLMQRIKALSFEELIAETPISILRVIAVYQNNEVKDMFWKIWHKYQHLIRFDHLTLKDHNQVTLLDQAVALHCAKDFTLFNLIWAKFMQEAEFQPTEYKKISYLELIHKRTVEGEKPATKLFIKRKEQIEFFKLMEGKYLGMIASTLVDSFPVSFKHLVTDCQKFLSSPTRQDGSKMVAILVVCVVEGLLGSSEPQVIETYLHNKKALPPEKQAWLDSIFPVWAKVEDQWHQIIETLLKNFPISLPEAFALEENKTKFLNSSSKLLDKQARQRIINLFKVRLLFLNCLISWDKLTTKAQYLAEINKLKQAVSAAVNLDWVDLHLILGSFLKTGIDDNGIKAEIFALTPKQSSCYEEWMKKASTLFLQEAKDSTLEQKKIFLTRALRTALSLSEPSKTNQIKAILKEHTVGQSEMQWKIDHLTEASWSQLYSTLDIVFGYFYNYEKTSLEDLIEIINDGSLCFQEENITFNKPAALVFSLALSGPSSAQAETHLSEGPLKKRKL